MSYQQGGIKISDTALHTGLDGDIVEVLEDLTGFDTANMQTKNDTTLAWAASVEMVSTGGEPTFNASGHVKGELIRMGYNRQRITAIKLNGGSVRVYNSGS
ncbi:hypothetical protein LCGC14_0463640 [marine sediment metagenome]|uniref:Uncharacterized protein n=1 Tax=marine sediment metagenome TaxID=412755 RepID=A0A0F9V0Z8_9ZZZZ